MEVDEKHEKFALHFAPSVACRKAYHKLSQLVGCVHSGFGTVLLRVPMAFAGRLAGLVANSISSRQNGALLKFARAFAAEPAAAASADAGYVSQVSPACSVYGSLPTYRQ